MKKEVVRKVIHLSGLLIPFICFQLDRAVLIALLLICFIISAISECIRLHYPRSFFFKSTFRHLARNSELNSPSGYFYFFLGATLTVTLFEPVVAAAALAASILGDVFSAPVGLYFKRLRGSEGGRALEGSLAGALAIWILSLTGSFPLSWIIIASATFIVVDFLKPRRIDDNLLFPLIISTAIYVYILLTSFVVSPLFLIGFVLYQYCRNVTTKYDVISLSSEVARGRKLCPSTCPPDP